MIVGESRIRAHIAGGQFVFTLKSGEVYTAVLVSLNCSVSPPLVFYKLFEHLIRRLLREVFSQESAWCIKPCTVLEIPCSDCLNKRM